MDTKTIYKKRTLFLLIITVAALVVCAASLSLKQNLTSVSGTPLSSGFAESHIVYYSSNAEVSQENSEGKTASEENISKKDTDFYLITVYEGKIGVFENGKRSSPPFLIADVNVYLLPDEDITLLKKGLRVQTLSQVKALLEDYH